MALRIRELFVAAVGKVAPERWAAFEPVRRKGRPRSPGRCGEMVERNGRPAGNSGVPIELGEISVD